MRSRVNGLQKGGDENEKVFNFYYPILVGSFG
jgi:hypothetical protein